MLTRLREDRVFVVGVLVWASLIIASLTWWKSCTAEHFLSSGGCEWGARLLYQGVGDELAERGSAGLFLDSSKKCSAANGIIKELIEQKEKSR